MRDFSLLNKTSKKSVGFLRQKKSCACAVHVLLIGPISVFDNFAQIFNRFGGSLEVSNFCEVEQLRGDSPKQRAVTQEHTVQI